ncbi:hypothetical protein IE53DRAFT_386407 [Violaceomyces palustris]|uniref:Uncharacterized protein n=1 Tax=Violaceomyces palustris TaxID=1673888 RepID=A0ACD0NZQ4_9BASI|nr:hypothetical protein IE53DRAFT_386407 [Violaceomyces palustris]
MKFTLLSLVTFAGLAAAAPGFGVVPATISAALSGHPNYFATFYGKTCATQASDYLTYSLQSSVGDCLSFCDSVKGCKFVNSYIDKRSSKETEQYTCSAYSKYHYEDSATNCGGQDQTGSGQTNYITDSAGFNRIY